MSVNEIRYLISENYYKHIEFSKENSCYSIKHLNIFFFLQLKYLKKIADPSNAKEQYQSFISKKNTKSVKQSKIITEQPKTFENVNIIDKKQLSQNIRKLRINHPRL